MRNLVLALVLLNLGFFAYAIWIDQPERTAADVAPALPKLLLASEFPAVPAQNQTQGAESAPQGTAPIASAAASDKPASTDAIAADATNPPVSGPSPTACVAVGPFNDSAGATNASSVLKGRGLVPHERRAPGDIADGFWVHIENIATATDQSRVMRALEQAGLSDASPIQSSDQIRHISVGIFSERGRAERRASAVKRLGIEAEVSPRTHPGTVYWLEMERKGDQPSVPIDGVTAPPGATLEVRACNAVPAGAPTARR